VNCVIFCHILLSGENMYLTFVLAQRPMDPVERFLFLPVFLLVGILLFWKGIVAFQNQRTEAEKLEIFLAKDGKHLEGPLAQLKGLGMCLGGVFVVLVSFVMLLLGRTLLP
jgi:hypothetical protein